VKVERPGLVKLSLTGTSPVAPAQPAGDCQAKRLTRHNSVGLAGYFVMKVRRFGESVVEV